MHSPTRRRGNRIIGVAGLEATPVIRLALHHSVSGRAAHNLHGRGYVHVDVTLAITDRLDHEVSNAHMREWNKQDNDDAKGLLLGSPPKVGSNSASMWSS